MDIKESIEKTRRGFEETFAAGDSYNWQSRDEEHLGKILGFINIRENMRALDLGTGRGYLAFPIAREHKDCEVVGLDIVNDALNQNRERAAEEGLRNLSFISYDGIDFPLKMALLTLL